MSNTPDQLEARQEDIVDNVPEEPMVHVSFPADDEAEFDGENLVISCELAVGWVAWTRIPRVVYAAEDGAVRKAGIQEKAWLKTIDGHPSESLTSEQVAEAFRRGARLGFNSTPSQNLQATPSVLDGKEALEASRDLWESEEEADFKTAEEVEVDLVRQDTNGMVSMEEEPAPAGQEAQGIIAKFEEPRITTEAGDTSASLACVCNDSKDSLTYDCETTGCKDAFLGESGTREIATTPEKHFPPPWSALPESEQPHSSWPNSERKRTSDKKGKKDKKAKYDKKKIKWLEANAQEEQENSKAKRSLTLVPNFQVRDSKAATFIDRGLLSQAEIPPAPPPDYRKQPSSSRSYANCESERRTKRRRREWQKDSYPWVAKRSQSEANRMNSWHEPAAEIQDRGSRCREEPEESCQAAALPCKHDSQEGDGVDSAVERDQRLREYNVVPYEASTSSAPVRERRQPQEGSERSTSSHSKEAESHQAELDERKQTHELARRLFGEKPLHQIISELDEAHQADLWDSNLLQVLQGFGKIRRNILRPQEPRPEICKCIWVGYFDRYAVTVKDVRAMFEKCGPVKHVFKGDHFAHVHWEESTARESVEAALRLSGELLVNDPIRVECRDTNRQTYEEKEYRDKHQLLTRIAQDYKKKDGYCTVCNTFNFFYRERCTKCNKEKPLVGWSPPTIWNQARLPPPGPPPAVSACPPVHRRAPDGPIPSPSLTPEGAWGPWGPPAWLRPPPNPSSSSAAGTGPPAEAMPPPPGPPPALPPGHPAAQQAAAMAYPAGMSVNGYWQYPAQRADSDSSYSDSYYSDESSSSATSKRKKRSKHKNGRGKAEQGSGTASQVAPEVPAVNSP